MPVINAFFFKKNYRIFFTFATQTNLFEKSDLIPLSVPLVMYIFGNPNIWIVLKIWFQIITTGSFIFGLIGLNAGHHHPDIVHEGDKLRYSYLQ